MLKLFDEGLLWPDCAWDLISLYAHAVVSYDAAINRFYQNLYNKISLLHKLFTECCQSALSLTRLFNLSMHYCSESVSRHISYIHRLTLACLIYIFIFTGTPVALTYWSSAPGFQTRCRWNLFNRDEAPLHTAIHYQPLSVLTWLKYFWKGHKIKSDPSIQLLFTMLILLSTLSALHEYTWRINV